MDFINKNFCSKSGIFSLWEDIQINGEFEYVALSDDAIAFILSLISTTQGKMLSLLSMHNLVEHLRKWDKEGREYYKNIKLDHERDRVEYFTFMSQIKDIVTKIYTQNDNYYFYVNSIIEYTIKNLLIDLMDYLSFSLLVKIENDIVDIQNVKNSILYPANNLTLAGTLFIKQLVDNPTIGTTIRHITYSNKHQSINRLFNEDEENEQKPDISLFNYSNLNSEYLIDSEDALIIKKLSLFTHTKEEFLLNCYMNNSRNITQLALAAHKGEIKQEEEEQEEEKEQEEEQEEQFLEYQKQNIEYIIEQLSEEWGISEEELENYYKTHGENVQQLVLVIREGYFD